MVDSDPPERPLELVAELTHRCPLGCPYCFNPLALDPRDRELDAFTWARVFGEAAALGVRQVHLSGGEPGARRDLVDITAHAREAGLATNLVTSGVGIPTRTVRELWEAGLDRVQVSFQDADAVAADRIAGARGAFQRKHAFAAEAVRLGLPLTVEVVLHRANLANRANLADFVDLALGLKADRIAIVHIQYEGWALRNRAALAPTAGQVRWAMAEIEALRGKHGSRLVIDMVPPGRQPIVTPSGAVLPCRAMASAPDVAFWSVRDHSLADIYASSPAFIAWRGADAWPQQPAASGSEFAAVHDGAPYAYRRM